MLLEPAPNRLSRPEITAVYERGPEAVILLVEELLDKIDGFALSVKRLEERLEVLEIQQRKTSRNSSKPPSGDGFGKPTQS
jgi:transposase